MQPAVRCCGRQFDTSKVLNGYNTMKFQQIGRQDLQQRQTCASSSARPARSSTTPKRSPRQIAPRCSSKRSAPATTTPLVDTQAQSDTARDSETLNNICADDVNAQTTVIQNVEFDASSSQERSLTRGNGSSPSENGSSNDVQAITPEVVMPGDDTAQHSTQQGWSPSAVMQKMTDTWNGLPDQLQMSYVMFLAFVLCNMDKVNISIAIIPMAQDYHWSPTTTGIIQSSFFYGFVLCQIPGGIISSSVGGRKVLPMAVALWSVATVLIPLAAGNIVGLMMVRALLGVGEGLAPAAATDMVSRVGNPEKRSTAMSLIFAGLPVGSTLGLLISPILVEQLGWRSVFIIFGSLGVGWITLWELYIKNVKLEKPGFFKLLSQRRLNPQTTNTQTDTTATLTRPGGRRPPGLVGPVGPQALPPAQLGLAASRPGGRRAGLPAGPAVVASAAGGSQEAVGVLASQSAGVVGNAGDEGEGASSNWREDIKTIPFKGILRDRSMQGMMYTHFCQSWFFFTQLSWMPTYYVDQWHTDLMHAATYTLLPPLAGSVVSAIAGPLSDKLIELNYPIPIVRKSMQTIGMLSPATLLLTLQHVQSPEQVVAATVAAKGLANFVLAGLYSTHADLSPRYASVLLGVTGTAGAIPGLIGVPLVGVVLQQTHSWFWALFAPCVGFLLSGAYVFITQVKHDEVDFEANQKGELAVERWGKEATQKVRVGAGEAWRSMWEMVKMQ